MFIYSKILLTREACMHRLHNDFTHAICITLYLYLYIYIMCAQD